MSSIWGNKLKISIFGESHGPGIGVVIDGFPAGINIDMEKVRLQMLRRAPGQDPTATPRKEKDIPEIISGFINTKTTGAPICAIIKNTNTKSKDYSHLIDSPRPGHSDFTADARYSSNNDVRGGGHFSGRLTAPIVFAGALSKQVLSNKGINIGAHISSIMNIKDIPFNNDNVNDKILNKLNTSSFSLIDESIENQMREVVATAKKNLNSVGGTIECAITGLNKGLGDPMFNNVESIISSIIFGIPAVKAIEFGKGFALTTMYGSESNDDFKYINNKVITTTNNCGGVLGGITTGMPITFKVAIKPTPSIGKKQNTVNLNLKENTTIETHGRHDPCIVPRAVPVIEAAAALAVMNIIL